MPEAEKLENTSNSPDADDHKRQPPVDGVDSLDASSISPNSVEGLLLLAVQKTNPADRKSFLKDACSHDAERRRRVDALLRAFDDGFCVKLKPPLRSVIRTSSRSMPSTTCMKTPTANLSRRIW